jgi:outer membrane protein
MKKLIYIIAAALLVGTTTANAQKTGHVNSQELVTALPGYKTAEGELKKYKDEMEAEYMKMKTKLDQMVDEYKKTSATMTDVQRKIKEGDIIDFENRLGEFEQTTTQNMQKREQMYMEPLIKQVKDAIAKVAKAQGINYVLDTGTLIYVDGGNDLQPLVKKELGIQ